MDVSKLDQITPSLGSKDKRKRRNPDELEEHGMIPGAVNIPIDQLEARLAEVPKDKPIVTYCMRGGRASRAAETLRTNGYTEPIEYGGITAWKEAGNEVVQPASE